MNLKLAVLVVVSTFCASFSYAAAVDTFGIGSKATALGGAFSAYADDPFATYYNPAGLTQIQKKNCLHGCSRHFA